MRIDPVHPTKAMIIAPIISERPRLRTFSSSSKSSTHWEGGRNCFLASCSARTYVPWASSFDIAHDIAGCRSCLTGIAFTIVYTISPVWSLLQCFDLSPSSYSPARAAFHSSSVSSAAWHSLASILGKASLALATGTARAYMSYRAPTDSRFASRMHIFFSCCMAMVRLRIWPLSSRLRRMVVTIPVYVVRTIRVNTPRAVRARRPGSVCGFHR
mmetsp:Transcript_1114/g.1722  ORF Transcript_1114/g.1722 Transcript_1114/m.1722 type:complete len:214 (-) Transcript_1114:405-1046(-)